MNCLVFYFAQGLIRTLQNGVKSGESRVKLRFVEDMFWKIYCEPLVNNLLIAIENLRLEYAMLSVLNEILPIINSMVANHSCNGRNRVTNY